MTRLPRVDDASGDGDDVAAVADEDGVFGERVVDFASEAERVDRYCVRVLERLCCVALFCF
jgi:hypothetical protein